MVPFEQLRLQEGIPIYMQIIQFLKAGISAGTIVHGDELPSRRTLSALLGVNPNTIQKAFRILEEEGLISSHTGAKSFVSVTQEQAQALRQHMPDGKAKEFVEQMQAMGLTCEETLALIARLWKEEAQ